MNIFGGNPAVVSTRTQGDTSKLPMDLNVTTSRVGSISRLVVGFVFVWLGYGFIGDTPGQLAQVPLVNILVYLGPIIVVIFGLVLFAQGFFNLNYKMSVQIVGDKVQVKKKSLLGSESWTEPLSAYQGLRWREIVVRRRVRVGSTGNSRRNLPRIYQVLDLYHSNPKRSIPLYVTRLREDRYRAFNKLSEVMERSEEARGKLGGLAGKIDDLQINTRSRWEQLAEVLGVPAIDTRDGMQQVRAAEEIDKSIRQMADEGKIHAEWDDRPPPNGLEVDYEGDEDTPEGQSIEVIIRAKKFPIWLYGGLVLICGFVFILGVFELELILLIFGGIIGAGTVWHWKSEEKNPRSLSITRSQLLIDTPNPGNATKSDTIDHTEIESVAITSRYDKSSFGPQLVVATDREEFKMGAGLSKDAIGWLRDLILSAVAKA